MDMWQAWLLALGLFATTLSSRVEVVGDRLHMSDILPQIPKPWAQVDLGEAPRPRQSRWLTAKEIHDKIKQAGMPDLPVQIPVRLQVYRQGQKLSAVQLRDLSMQALLGQLPANVVLRDVIVQSGLVVGTGLLQVRLLQHGQFVSGKQTVLLGFDTADGSRTQMPVQIMLSKMAPTQEKWVQRHEEVQIELHTQSVSVRTKGIAQQAGAEGEMISVLPSTGTRVLRGRVIAPQVVEVLP